MPTWSGILDELGKSAAQRGQPDFDGVRRKYLLAAHRNTGRNVILYATKWTQPDPQVSPELITIVDEDLQGIMEVVHGLSDPRLDLILHSPGGSLEATEALVNYLRSKFRHIRVIVPQMAMSAATMIACAADVVVLGKHSFLGPIDPQFTLNTPLGPRLVPAQAILDQFEFARKECMDPSKMGAWLPMLGQYGPDLLVKCRHAIELSEELARNWLEAYMFRRGSKEARKKQAKDIAAWLSDHREFKTHNRHIPRHEAKRRGLRIRNLESDQAEQDLFLSVLHATTHTFSGTPAVKIIENHLGKAFVKLHSIVVPGPLPQDTPRQ
jgi:hypothetical protein